MTMTKRIWGKESDKAGPARLLNEANEFPSTGKILSKWTSRYSKRNRDSHLFFAYASFKLSKYV